MTEREALHAAVLESPEDNLPRLVFADWLEENGEQVRAEFIRTSIEFGYVGENGWTLQPHVHHKKKQLFIEEILHPEQYLYRRGFIDEVRAPLVTLIGGDCPGCSGRGEERYTDAAGSGDWRPCEDCGGVWPNKNGTGRVEGNLPLLVRKHPITRVVATDREPLVFDDRFLWHNGEHDLVDEFDHGDHLPSFVFDELKGFQKRTNTRMMKLVKSFVSKPAANNALSAALLRIAKRTEVMT